MIEKLRKELENVILNKEDYNKILEKSQELDKCIIMEYENIYN